MTPVFYFQTGNRLASLDDKNLSNMTRTVIFERYFRPRKLRGDFTRLFIFKPVITLPVWVVKIIKGAISLHH